MYSTLSKLTDAQRQLIEDQLAGADDLIDQLAQVAGVLGSLGQVAWDHKLMADYNLAHRSAEKLVRAGVAIQSLVDGLGLGGGCPGCGHESHLGKDCASIHPGGIVNNYPKVCTCRYEEESKFWENQKEKESTDAT